MTTQYLLKKIKLSESDLEEIKNSVRKAESKTNGEIALALTAESDSYSFWELLSSIYVAAAVFVILLPFTGSIYNFYEQRYWNIGNQVMPAFFGAAIFISITAAFFAMNIPFIDRIIIPKSVQKSKVTAKAFEHFAKFGVHETAGHSGILIFVSYLERQVRIIADSGIAEKIPQDLWNIIADDLADGIKTGNTKEGFINAVEKCGELLSENFPAGNDNPNELADGLVILN